MISGGRREEIKNISGGEEGESFLIANLDLPISLSPHLPYSASPLLTI